MQPGGVVFPAGSLAPSGVKLIPTQLSSGQIFNMAFLMIIAAKFSYTAVMKRKADLVRKLPESIWQQVILILILHNLRTWKICIEFLRNDYRGEVGIFSTSQFISFIVLLGVVAMAVNHKLKNADR